MSVLLLHTSPNIGIAGLTVTAKEQKLGMLKIAVPAFVGVPVIVPVILPEDVVML